MAKKKADAKDKPLLELSMDRDIMHEAIRAITTFSSYDLHDIRIEIYRHGLILICGDAGMVSTMTVALGKKAFKSYNARESTFISLIDKDLNDLKSLISSATPATKKIDLPLKISFTPPNILKANIGTLKKTIKPKDRDSEQSLSMFNQMKKLYQQMESVAKLDSEEFLITIKDMSYQTIHNDGTAYASFLKPEGKDLELSMNLDIGDDVSATFKPHRKIPFSAKVDIDCFKRGIIAIRPLAMRASKHIFLNGKDDFPLIFTCHGTDPEKASAFDNDIEIWYAIAPTIVSE